MRAVLRHFVNGEIPVVVHEPEGMTIGTVVLLHGLMGYKDSEKFVAMAESLSENGLRAVMFDQAGSGESKSPLKHSLIFSRFRDLVTVIEWIKCDVFKSGEKLFLWGSSFGGYLAYLYGFLYQDVVMVMPEKILPDDHPLKADALISWATPFDVSALEGFLRRSKPFCDFLDPADPLGHPKNLEKIGVVLKAQPEIYRPCLIVHGIKDEIVPWNDAVRIRDVTGGDMILFDEADHRFLNSEDRSLAIRASLSWLLRRLGSSRF
ncbi:MAG: alpha/beta fold hydrolase [Thermodesulforhabdaceae bacterium]